MIGRIHHHTVLLSAIIAVVVIIFTPLGTVAAQQIGTGQTNDNKAVIIYSDGTWKYDKKSGTKKARVLSFKAIKEKAYMLCDPQLADLVVGMIIEVAPIEEPNNVSIEKYWACVDKASGCSELSSLVAHCKRPKLSGE